MGYCHWPLPSADLTLSATFTEVLVTDISGTFGSQTTLFHENQSSQNVEPDRRTPICANPPTISRLRFSRSRRSCSCPKQSQTECVCLFANSDGPLSILNTLHLSPVSPTPLQLLQPFVFPVLLYSNPQFQQHVVFGYSFCYTLACVTTRILRNISLNNS